MSDRRYRMSDVGCLISDLVKEKCDYGLWTINYET